MTGSKNVTFEFSGQIPHSKKELNEARLFMLIKSPKVRLDDMKRRSPSVSQYSKTMGSGRRRIDYYKYAISIVDGVKSVEDVPDADVKETLINLAVLRCESNHLEDHERTERIAKLIVKLNSRLRPPPMRRRHSSLRSPRSPRSPSTSASQSPSPKTPVARSPSGRSPSVRPIRRNPIVLTPSPKTPVDAPVEESESRQQEDMELEKYLEILNEIIEGGYPEIEEDDSKRKLLNAISVRTKEAIEDGDYDLVRELDRIADEVNATWTLKVDPMKIKMRELAKRLEYLEKRKGELEDEKTAEMLNLTKLQHEKLDELQSRFEEEREQLPARFPNQDDRRYQKSSTTLLLLRDAERRYVMARDYDAAKAVRKRADAQEKWEKETKRDEMTKTCERMRDKLFAEQKMAQQAFDLKWEARIGAVETQYEARLFSLQRMIDRVTEDMQNTRRLIVHVQDEYQK